MKRLLKSNIFLIVICLIIILIYSFSLNKFLYKNTIANKNNNTHAINHSPIKDASDFKNRIANAEKTHMPPSDMIDGYGLRLFDWNGNYISDNSLKYMDQPMKYYLSIVNGYSFKDKINLVVTVCGKPVPYSIDDQKENNIYSCYIDARSLINLPITLNLENNLYKNNEDILFILTCGMDENSNTNTPSAYYTLSIHKIIDTSNSTIKIVDKNRDYEDNNVCPIIDNNITETELYAKIDNQKNNKICDQPAKLSTKRSQLTSLYLIAGGGKGNYSTIIILGDKILPVFDDQDELIWEIKENEYIQHEFKFNAPENIGNYSMYSISVPLNSEDTTIVCSQNFTLKVTD